jgi:hypothetical protein
VDVQVNPETGAITGRITAKWETELKPPMPSTSAVVSLGAVALLPQGKVRAALKSLEIVGQVVRGTAIGCGAVAIGAVADDKKGEEHLPAKSEK